MEIHHVNYIFIIKKTIMNEKKNLIIVGLKNNNNFIKMCKNFKYFKDNYGYFFIKTRIWKK
jgi:hypothetical protein